MRGGEGAIDSRGEKKAPCVFTTRRKNPIVTGVTACPNTLKYLTFLRRGWLDLFRFTRSVSRTMKSRASFPALPKLLYFPPISILVIFDSGKGKVCRIDRGKFSVKARGFPRPSSSPGGKVYGAPPELPLFFSPPPCVRSSKFRG